MLWQKYTFYTFLLPFLHVVNDFRCAFTHTAIFTLNLWSKECEKDTLLFYTCVRTETETSGVCVSCMPRLSSAAHDHKHSAQMSLLVHRSGEKKRGTFAESKLAMLPSSATQWLFAEFKTGTFGFKWDETQHDRVARLDFRYIKLLVEFCQLKNRLEGL